MASNVRKPNVRGLLLLAGGSQRLASRRKTKSQVTSVSLPFITSGYDDNGDYLNIA